jgi:glyceraldehyde-3-phosphate dehydrogenase type II
VKGIFQGGEKHDLTGYSFVAQVNYEGAINRDFVRVVSCNTTALSRVLNVGGGCLGGCAVDRPTGGLSHVSGSQ